MTAASDSSSYRPPTLVRVLLSADRLIGMAMAIEHNLLTGILDHRLDEDKQDALTRWLYDHQAHYLPEADFNQLGLFAWEREVFGSPPFPPKGHVLLGAAGGGRELAALCGLGYTVVAFEPSRLVEGARRVAARHGAIAVEASYADLVDAAWGRPSPLAPFLDDDFDAVVLGFGSLSHIRDAGRRLELIKAIRTAAPSAIVVASFESRRASSGGSPIERSPSSSLIRHGVSRLIRSARTRHEGVQFSPVTGFSHLLTTSEIIRLAEASGYTVGRMDERDYPHVVLAPVMPAEARLGQVVGRGR